MDVFLTRSTRLFVRAGREIRRARGMTTQKKPCLRDNPMDSDASSKSAGTASIPDRNTSALNAALLRDIAIIAHWVAESIAWLDSSCPSHLGSNRRSEEHTSELQSLMRISYAVFCLNNKHNKKKT